MTAPRLSWQKKLSSYPGQSLGDRFFSAKRGKTFEALGKEFGVSASSVKSFAYRALEYQGEIQREHIVYKHPHLNYASLLNRVVSMLAKEKGLRENEYREWIVGEGEREFEERGDQMGIQLYRCRKED